jgi:hypothetical protein
LPRPSLRKRAMILLHSSKIIIARNAYMPEHEHCRTGDIAARVEFFRVTALDPIIIMNWRFLFPQAPLLSTRSGLTTGAQGRDI